MGEGEASMETNKVGPGLRAARVNQSDTQYRWRQKIPIQKQSCIEEGVRGGGMS